MKINKSTFNRYIADSDFQGLFVSEMLWNNPQGQTVFDINVEESVYTFRQIAQRSGFQVLTCEVDSIPTSSVVKKIDTRLRRQANDYICIYYIPESHHHLWTVPVNKVEKRDLVMVEYETVDSASFLYEKMDVLSFDFDDHTTIVDVKERVQGAFIINSEKVTKDFYKGFRNEHTNFAKYITGIDDEIKDLKKNRNKQWYTSVMLNRLMFCYFIQKKGFLNEDIDYLQRKLLWVKKEKGANRFYGSFYKGFLLSLFHDGLNSPRHQQDFVEKYGRIPYLNGGMFSIHELEEKYPSLDIKDEAFESLFSFFDQWHWHLDDRLTASGKDINPDVLGYIFEQYINDRAQMGAYYTKEDITEYIGRNTILPFLMDATKRADERPLKSNGEVWQFLKESGDTYIFDAVKKGAGLEIPEHIAVGINTSKPNLLERRSRWNEKTSEDFALPTEIWRETIERLQRYENIKQKITSGEITEINDLITYNLNIRQFVQDWLSKTEDHLFIKHFYAQLRKVTILDPTCGSGAFLFAALNILEPLYEICIDRMQGWNEENPKLFVEELQEIAGKYRSNIRYFIYKNIILRNLYGVDIMVEATEIAKLRLFLKMVAVVDVNPREENLGLDPLPDVDFNIRCGNTLVGYATKDDLEKDLKYGDMFANMEFKDKVHTEMDIVAHAYETFKKVQLEQSSDLETYRNAKQELKQRLKNLDELLNRKLYASTATETAIKYDEWLKSHQPFHWLAEYYDIINGNGGFDVVIGNPPYVVYGKEVQTQYRIHGYQSITCNNLYGFVLERSHIISKEHAKLGYIIPISSIAFESFGYLQNLYLNNSCWISNYAATSDPGILFVGVKLQLSIILLSKDNKKNSTYTTSYRKWYINERNLLFTNISYAQYYFAKDYSISKLKDNRIESGIINKILSDNLGVINTINIGKDHIYYKKYGNYFWKMFLDYIPYFDDGIKNKSGSIASIEVSKIKKYEILSVLNSTSFYYYYMITSDCRNLTIANILSFKYDCTSDTLQNDLIILGKELSKDVKKRSKIRVENLKNGGVRKVEIFSDYKKSKPIIDEIDKVLAEHYGFTDEELDFIINYDIKYRMGDELNEDE